MPLELKIEDTLFYKEATMKGKLEGKLEGKIEVIIEMLKKGKYSKEEIADIAKVTIPFVEKIAADMHSSDNK